MRPLSHDTLGKRHAGIARRMVTEEHKPNLPGYWIYLGTFIAVGNPGNDPSVVTTSSPDYQNGYAYFGPPYDYPAFRHGLDGLLEWKGMVDASMATSGAVLCTLPPEWRPATDTKEPTFVYDGLDIVTATLSVDASTGDVTLDWLGCCCAMGYLVVDKRNWTTGNYQYNRYDYGCHDPRYYDLYHDTGYVDPGTSGSDRYGLKILQGGEYLVETRLRVDLTDSAFFNRATIDEGTWDHGFSKAVDYSGVGGGLQEAADWDGVRTSSLYMPAAMCVDIPTMRATWPDTSPPAGPFEMLTLLHSEALELPADTVIFPMAQFYPLAAAEPVCALPDCNPSTVPDTEKPGWPCELRIYRICDTYLCDE